MKTKKMKVSENFHDSEFLSRESIKKIKSINQPTTRYINKHLVLAAEFVRALLNEKLKSHYPDMDYASMTGNIGVLQTRGHRFPWDKTSGAKMSDHKFMNAFDSDVYIHYSDGSKKEADYKIIQEIMIENSDELIRAGITMIEHVDYASTWLHFSIAWMPNLKKLKVIKP